MKTKEVNDTRGHEVGDSTLQLVAQRLRGLVRETDTVARIGGDEFSLLLPGLGDPEDAATAADKIVRGLEKPFVLDGAELRVTTSVGVAIFPEDGDDGVSLMRKADRAMYRAKRAGRSAYRLYSSASVSGSEA